MLGLTEKKLADMIAELGLDIPGGSSGDQSAKPAKKKSAAKK
jgi:hypothetical protein